MRLIARHALGPLTGTVQVPGDKSLSHRAVLFASMAEGTSRVTGVLDSADVRSTIEAVKALGARVSSCTSDGPGLVLEITGWGATGPQATERAVDCGNSGTTARLLLGVLAGWPIAATLVGDDSLSTRPMRRVTEPLEEMGATFSTTDGHLPITVRGAALHGIAYKSPIASAQVKTAVLLAGLRAEGRTSVREPSPSRDHTERMLPAFGVPVGRGQDANMAWVDGPAIPRAHGFSVPADPSSAAFLSVAALLVRGSRVVLKRVGANPTRIGFVRVLERMSADVEVSSTSAGRGVSQGEEPVADIEVRAGALLVGTTVTQEEVPSLIDEVPILALAATQAVGTTRFQDVGELRVKESDRLSALAEGLASLGADVAAGADWLLVNGPTPLHGAELSSFGDHRLAMTWIVAGLIADGPVVVEGSEAIDISYPSFVEDLSGLLSGVDAEGRALPRQSGA